MTCSPSFYKHTQKLFLLLHKRGLAYQKEALVNWDPVDKTVLANEQVGSDGRSWRSGAVVQKVRLKQWFFRITAFRDALLRDLDVLAEHNQWPERVLTQQRNWLGRSTGARIKFEVSIDRSPSSTVEVFTTRPDTLFGVQYLALSTTHPIVQRLVQSLPELRHFLARADSLPPESKDGFLLPGITATSPLELIAPEIVREKRLPVYVAPYVLSGYGEGAVMGVPGHDSRDLSFWRQQNPSAAVSTVIRPVNESSSTQTESAAGELSEALVEQGLLNEKCGKYSGLRSEDGGKQIVADLESHGQNASLAENWRLRDWLISRQRYWGTPIPIVHCKSCGAVPVPEARLPVELPQLDESIRGKTGNPLERIKSWVNTTCPSCNQPAKRDTDTMDTFVDSSWYYMRFPDAHNNDQPFSKEAGEAFLPVDTYIGGIEHAILHLLYARFMYKFLATEGLLPQHQGPKHSPPEPFRRLISQGMVHGKTFSNPATGRFLHPSEVEGADSSNPKIRASGVTPAVTFEKMSKSKYNGVDPSVCIAKYGADATRAHMLFSAPVNEVLEWDEEKIVGIKRWFDRISSLMISCDSYLCRPGASDPDFKFTHCLITAESNPLGPKSSNMPLLTQFLLRDNRQTEALLFVVNTINSINRTFEHNLYALNTTVSDLTKLTNKLVTFGTDPIDPEVMIWPLTALLRMLAPIAPGFAEECWKKMQTNAIFSSICTSHWPNSRDSIIRAPFPTSPLTSEAETSLLKQRATFRCTVQTNGKVRFSVELPTIPVGDVETIGEEQEHGGAGLMQRRLAEQILSTREGKYWLTEKNEWEKRKRLIVIDKQDGNKLVNVEFRKW